MRLSGILMAVDHRVAIGRQNQFKIRRHFAALSAADSWIRFRVRLGVGVGVGIGVGVGVGDGDGEQSSELQSPDRSCHSAIRAVPATARRLLSNVSLCLRQRLMMMVPCPAIMPPDPRQIRV